MVTPNVDALTDEFENVVEERDLLGVGTIGLAGAAGGVVATQLAGRIAPVLGFSESPSDATGLLVNGTIKMVVGAGLAFAATQVGGTAGLILGVSGLGGLILGGGDWINAALATDAGVPAASPSRGNARARVVSSSTTSRSMHDDMDRTQFRAADTGRGGTPDQETTFR